MKSALVAVTVVFLFSSTLLAQGDSESSRKTMKDLTGIYVDVSLPPDAAQIGLSEAQVRADVELWLRMAGIRVLTREEWLKVLARPVLVIDLALYKMKSVEGNYSHYINVRLNQSAMLPRDPQTFISADTWDVASVGVVNASSTKWIRDQIKDQVDLFINAWFSMNPKR